ncbi:glycosyltransferase family 4 protein [Bradyrhizobium sp. 193]|uniref:glycosyltransferase family 4 protein n=1 Tax=Bradyrhizobium sp. 193 TaxID=2782661 RepID=UPI001FF78911|nr:glycosyltransferase family 4 protein [Bradyrhizobium sp. 193]MCK1485648.1 glycosyltransferase family 4 protein [Bradyrhizobium sp. 193]
MIETLHRSAEVHTINTSPGDRQGVRKHFHKTHQTLRACWRLITDRGYELVYLGCEGDLGLIYTAALVLSARLFGHPVLLHHHSFSYIDKSSGLMRLILSTGGTRIRHIFLCTTMQNRFESRYGKVSNSRIVSNAAFVQSETQGGEIASENRTLRIGLLSNLTREKGLYTFLDLLRLVRKSGLDVEGLLAGPIANEEDRTMVAMAEKELRGALQYLGPLYGDAKARFYSQVDIFVFPTEYANEAEPTVIFEALAAGNSVVAFDRGCIRSQIGDHGITILPNEHFCARAGDYVAQRIREHSLRGNHRKNTCQHFQQKQAAAMSSAMTVLE